MPINAAQRAATTQRLQRLAWLLDSRFAVPLTGGKARVGLDFLVGLIPVIGDGAMALLGLYIVFQARRLGTPWPTIGKMLGFVFLDFLIGDIPILGDIADAVLKVNLRNLRMIGIEPKDGRP